MPQSLKELQSFLGGVNYISRFISRLSELREPLQKPVKNTEFVWMDYHTNVFNSIKDAISTDCLVDFLDPTKPIFNESDARLQGIGSILLQSESNYHPDGLEITLDLRPMTFASKSLSEIEKHYSNIKQELLGIVFSVLHFKH